MAKKKKSVILSNFAKFYFTYLVIIIAALVFVFFSVKNIMIEYENSQPDKFVIGLIRNARPGDEALGDYLARTCLSENAPGDSNARSSYFYGKNSSAVLAAKKDLLNSGEDLEVYNVTANDKPFASVAIRKTGSKNKLGILSIVDYELSYAFLRNENSERTKIRLSDSGCENISIIYPEDFTLKIDGGEVNYSVGSEVVLEDFANIGDYDVIPCGIKLDYSLNFEPSIAVENNAGREVALVYENGVYTAGPDYEPSSEAEAVADEIGDIIDLYELWARFMYDDAGYYYHGLYEVLSGCRILDGSRLEQQAIDWANSIDITFVYDHYNYYFENEKIGNYILYNDNFFSCDVSFDETLTLYNYGDTEVSFNNRLFFIKDGWSWYWVGQLDLTNK